MKNLWKRARRSLLLKTSFFNGIATFVRIIVGIVSTKVIAVMLGPSGIALLGNFNNVFSMVSTLGSGGINGGVIKYVAEYKGTDNVRAIVRNSILITIITSTATSIFLLIFNDSLSSQVFYDASFSWVFIVLALALPFIVFKRLFTSIFNGYKDFFKIIATNIAFSFITLGITILLVWKYDLIGAALAVIISALLTSFVIFFMFRKATWYSELHLFPSFNKDAFIKLAKFSLMAFVAMFFAIFIKLMLRKYIIANISLDVAGYWQSVTKVTDLFISMFTMTLSLYFLPRFSELTDNKELELEIKKAMIFISPPLIIGLLVIYGLRHFVVLTLFSPEFLPMEPLFLFQLIGSYFKVIAWVLGFVLLAKAMTKMFIFTEIFFGSSYFILFIFLVKYFGIIGATYAFALNYLFYLVFLMIYFRRKLV